MTTFTEHGLVQNIARAQGGLSHMLDILVIVIVVLAFSGPSSINEFMDGDA
ncbi:hypothetical protein INS43_11490 [Corynebacterium aurimucosum]|uniref:Uncharacterized protein n=1 Tax=Corynebacterium hesseae TaxID=2913502 RepID=A0ABU9UKN2_9CORY|nr:MULTISPECIES: hypothetical protein [Corynebacterium]MBE7337893.1 hypothetical protein [Corynebacterium aurimucosum]MBE7365783.1 hypothetical protein [Corynebacterium aurimucosum]HCT9180617.1 hypothetical protein [Corynebacterium aurimucosum]